MILVIAPAIDGLRREWREAAANLGATPRQFWRYVGLPVLTPSLLGAMVLLFGNSFAAYATAYGLTGGSVSARADHDRLLRHRRRALEPASRARRSRSGCSSSSRVMMAIYVPLQRHLVAVGAVRTRAARAERRALALRRRRLLPDPAHRDAAVQPQGRPDRQVLHARELRRDPRRPAVLEDAADLVRPRARDDRDRARAARPDRLLGAPEAAAPAPRDRLPRADPVRRPADHPRRRAARRLQRRRRRGSTRSRTASSSPRT